MTWLSKFGIFIFWRLESNIPCAIIKVVDVLQNFGTNIFFVCLMLSFPFGL